MTVFAWPPVGLSSEPVWHRMDPVQTSRSILTGKRYTSAHGRNRLWAEFSVSARQKGGDGGRYMQSLARLIEGGVHFVRLYHKPRTAITGRAATMLWYAEGGTMTWTSAGSEMIWYTGDPGVATLTTDGPFAAVSVTGLPASTLVCAVGEFVRIGDETRTCIKNATSDASGTALIRLDAAFTAGGAVTLGDVETGVFEPVSIPRGGGPLAADYTYDWAFREVFADEVGDQTEVNPWL